MTRSLLGKCQVRWGRKEGPFRQTEMDPSQARSERTLRSLSERNGVLWVGRRQNGWRGDQEA